MNATIEAFKQAMQATGIEPPADVLADGALHRFTVSGDRPRSENGWYVLHADSLPAGRFGCWKRGVDETWCGKSADTLTPAERAQHKKTLDTLRQQRAADEAQRQANCRRTAARIWEKATEAGTDQNAYTVRQKIKPYVARTGDRGNLIIPVYDIAGQLHGLQFISPTKDPATGRDKNFLTATVKRGNFCFIGEDPVAELVICEGWATGCSLHEATGLPVAVAFDSGNLTAVAKAWREKLPEAQIIIAADDDYTQEGNPGRTKAAEAAQAVGGTIALPNFANPFIRGTDFNDLHKVEGLAVVGTQLKAVLPASQPPVDRSLFVSVGDFLCDDVSVSYLIRKMVERDTTGQLFGPSGGGKSFVALDWAFSVATGSPVNGNKTAQGLVIYLAGEGHSGLRRRAKAWQIHRGMSVGDFRRVHLSRRTITFDGGGLSEAKAEIKALAEAHSSPVALIVVDTLARHLEGDENSTKDMGAFIKAVDDLRGTFPGSVALIVHHSGHGEETKTRARGSSALRAAMDFEIQCNAGLLTFTKMKDAEQPEPVPFKLCPVAVGVDEDGDPLTSCVVEYGERSAKNRETPLNKGEQELLQLVKENPGILSGDLRSALLDKRRQRDPDAKYDTIKKAFLRSLDGLIDKGIVFMDGHAVKLGQGTKEGQQGDMSPLGGGTDRDTLLKECPFVPPCPSDDPDFPF